MANDTQGCVSSRPHKFLSEWSYQDEETRDCFICDGVSSYRSRVAARSSFGSELRSRESLGHEGNGNENGFRESSHHYLLRRENEVRRCRKLVGHDFISQRHAPVRLDSDCGQTRRHDCRDGLFGQRGQKSNSDGGKYR